MTRPAAGDHVGQCLHWKGFGFPSAIGITIGDDWIAYVEWGPKGFLVGTTQMMSFDDTVVLCQGKQPWH